jgi:hypothetical protein
MSEWVLAEQAYVKNGVAYPLLVEGQTDEVRHLQNPWALAKGILASMCEKELGYVLVMSRVPYPVCARCLKAAEEVNA